MAHQKHTSRPARTSTHSIDLPKPRALYLVPPPADADTTRAILQSAFLLAAFDWTAERGWIIRYFADDAPADVQGAAWRALYFGAEQPIATSEAAASHPSLRLLGEEERDTVWRIARTVLHQLEAAVMRRAEADARAA